MKRIVVSYRRDDTSGEAGRLYDRLIFHFGADNVFRDQDAIAPGTDFIRRIDREVKQAGAVVAIIGPTWLDQRLPDGERRIDNKHDFVRRELNTALHRAKPLVAVTVRGAAMPQVNELPRSLARLAHVNALGVSDTHFDIDVRRLIEALDTRRCSRTGAPSAIENAYLGVGADRKTNRGGESTLAALTLAVGVVGLVLPLVGWLGVRWGRAPARTFRWDRNVPESSRRSG